MEARNLPEVSVAPASACDVPVAPERELVIRALSVVEDPVRTQWNGDPDDPVSGAWHFGKLMTHMAGDQDPSQFVLSWLATWRRDRTVNGQTVPARTAINQIIAAWPRLSDNRLDLTRPPLRLLAIVNRLDLAGDVRAGEGRFVFGVLDAAGNSTQFTVILEYDLPFEVSSLPEWAEAWHALASLELGTEAYNAALQGLTDAFSGPGARPDRPNGSAISQVRTNEIHLNAPWELREFALNANGRLTQRTVALTPTNSFEGTQALGRFVNNNEAAILAGTHTVPLQLGQARFRGGAVLNNIDFWSAPNITNNEARHLFSLNTCNGCHGAETQTGFLHVFPREQGQRSELSGFMTGLDVADPVTGEIRHFDDIGRRAAHLTALLCGAAQ